MKKILSGLTIVLILSSCSNKEQIEASKPIAEIKDSKSKTDLLTKKEINAIINESLKSKGDFDWTIQDAHTIWSAIKHSDNLLTIGYGESKDNLARNSKSENIKDDLIKLVRGSETTSARGVSDIYINETINIIDIEVTNKKTIESLLKDSRVRYIEPSNYQLQDTNDQSRSSGGGGSGCGYDKKTLDERDYRTIAPGARVPWSFDAHNIPKAWNYSTGNGITIGFIDTGLSSEQKWMNEYFNDGYSTGRTVERYGKFVDSMQPWSNNYDGVDDKCGHGTKMASIATAPRNDDNLPLGVAYNANLVTVRGAENVLINDYHEKRGVVEALTILANRSDVKIISMSIGSPFKISKVSDAIKYAYSKGKMILAAGGTSTSYTRGFGVIFPANMKETVAVTGVIEEELFKDYKKEKCSDCHTGSKIDFTVQMERKFNTSNSVPCLSYYNNEATYVGGSSVATATTAGIAALVWSKHPNWSRDQVLQKMKQSAEFFPKKSTEFGHGNIDAYQAVRD